MIPGLAVRQRMAEKPNLGFIQARNELISERHRPRVYPRPFPFNLIEEQAR